MRIVVRVKASVYMVDEYRNSGYNQEAYKTQNDADACNTDAVSNQVKGCVFQMASPIVSRGVALRTLADSPVTLISSVMRAALVSGVMQ